VHTFDVATNKWERFHPTDYLPEGAPKRATAECAWLSHAITLQGEITLLNSGSCFCDRTKLTMASGGVLIPPVFQ